jgi:ABC-type sulfate transport system permease subunit
MADMHFLMGVQMTTVRMLGASTSKKFFTPLLPCILSTFYEIRASSAEMQRKYGAASEISERKRANIHTLALKVRLFSFTSFKKFATSIKGNIWI